MCTEENIAYMRTDSAGNSPDIQYLRESFVRDIAKSARKIRRKKNERTEKNQNQVKGIRSQNFG